MNEKNTNFIDNKELKKIEKTIRQTIAEIKELQKKYEGDSEVKLELTLLYKHQNFLSETQRILVSLNVEDNILSTGISQKQDTIPVFQETILYYPR